MHSRFRMKDLGKATYLLEMEIRKQPKSGILLLQEKYTREVLAAGEREGSCVHVVFLEAVVGVRQLLSRSALLAINTITHISKLKNRIENKMGKDMS